MPKNAKDGLRAGMQNSPWIILGLTVILLIVVLVLAIQNTNRERRYMSELLIAKGAALIRGVEAGARTGMMGMMWGGQQIQRLLEETARLPDVVHMAVIDEGGHALAHSDPGKINKPFDPKRQIIHSGPEDIENWELVSQDDGSRIFEVHRHFRPMRLHDGKRFGGRMQSMMQRRGMRRDDGTDWMSLDNRKDFLIIIGLDVTPFEEAVRSDIRTTILLSIIMLVLGFGGFVSLFWMHNYRSTKKSLQDTSAFADEVVGHLPVGLIATDRSGRITFFNSAAESITGLAKTNAIARKPDAILPEGLCGLQKMLDRGQTITEQEMECAFSARGKTAVSVSATKIANQAGELVGQVLILRDLSEIRRLEAEIHRQEKLAAMGGLAAGVAHEVRNPLSSIKALASYFAGQFDQGSEARQAADVMAQEVDRLNRVITELLEFARPTDLKLTPTDLGSLLSRSIQLIQQDAVNNQVSVESEMNSALCMVRVDPDRLAQCLLNLYINAIQAMPHGGFLKVLCQPVKSDHVSISVIDTGTGIPSDDVNRIFDPYFTTKENGTGLGLAIVYKIVEAHQGRITVGSNPGGGTIFTISLPCEQNIADTRVS